tara:strand:- start:407 stop:628 length:222 start_codon:yes stop_codon:yes gene_type:complete
MDNMWRMINDIVSNLTSVVTGLLGLGIVAGVAYGGPVLGMNVIEGITTVVSSLASEGLVGLLVLAVIMSLLSK